MKIYQFESGRQRVTLSDPLVSTIDAETNKPFFLADWKEFRRYNSGVAGSLAYPFRLDAGSSPVTLNGGHFYGNIPENVDWDDFYQGRTPTEQYARFNSALLLVRNNVRTVLNDLEFGVRDDLDSGYVDGLRLNAAGNSEINRPRAWLGRDDWLECDDRAGFTHVINDGFLENQFCWLSGTGNIPTSKFIANRCVVHFRLWLYQGQLTHGPLLKVDSPTASPSFEFNDVTLVIDWRNGIGRNGRTKHALAKTVAKNSRVMVQGSEHQDRELIGMFVKAGFRVYEETTAEEWQSVKQKALQEIPKLPPIETTPKTPVQLIQETLAEDELMIISKSEAQKVKKV